MQHKDAVPKWWGAPRDFSTSTLERKISWLELFYDLVYVVAISTTTHWLAEHLNFSGWLDFIYLFLMIFWGWFNGSLHHDLHSSVGLRTRLMTLWQIMIVAAIIVAINSDHECYIFNATITFMLMQLFITYLWWSVGIYDKAHRKLNRPFTICFLVSWAFMFATFYLPPQYIRITFYASLILNYAPFIAPVFFKDVSTGFTFSSSMIERLGLFTTIVFGEVVFNIINGIVELHVLNYIVWIQFVISILIAFLLWWIYFTLIADRKTIQGKYVSHILLITYIFTLMSLAVLAVAFNKIFITDHIHSTVKNYKFLFGYGTAAFISGNFIVTYFLMYLPIYKNVVKWLQLFLVFSIIALILITYFNQHFPLTLYLSFILILLLCIVIFLFRSWVKAELNNPATQDTSKENEPILT